METSVASAAPAAAAEHERARLRERGWGPASIEIGTFHPPDRPIPCADPDQPCSIRRPAAPQNPRLHGRGGSPCWRSASARTRRCSASSTRCCFSPFPANKPDIARFYLLAGTQTKPPTATGHLLVGRDYQCLREAREVFEQPPRALPMTMVVCTETATATRRSFAAIVSSNYFFYTARRSPCRRPGVLDQEERPRWRRPRW